MAGLELLAFSSMGSLSESGFGFEVRCLTSLLVRSSLILVRSLLDRGRDREDFWVYRPSFHGCYTGITDTNDQSTVGLLFLARPLAYAPLDINGAPRDQGKGVRDGSGIHRVLVGSNIVDGRIDKMFLNNDVLP